MDKLIQNYKLFLLNQFDLNEAEKMSRLAFMQLIASCVVSYMNKNNLARTNPDKQYILSYTRQLLNDFQRNEQTIPQFVVDSLKQEICPDFTHDIQTSLQVCVQKSKPYVIDMLIQAGADVNHKDGNGKTPLMYAVSHINEHTPEIIDMLLKNGADINAETNDGSQVLHCFKPSENDETTRAVFDKLMQRGADLYAGNKAECTPLIQAVRANSLSLVKRIINGVGKELPKAERGRLLKNYINKQNAFGQTALYYAIAKQNSEMIKLLVASGADLKAKNTREQTPLMQAIDNNHLSIVKTLIECGAKINDETLKFLQETKARKKVNLQQYQMIKQIETYIDSQIRPTQKTFGWFRKSITREKE